MEKPRHAGQRARAGSKQNLHDYPYASSGWGSLEAVTRILVQKKMVLRDARILPLQNKPDGFMCVSCSWAKPAHPHAFEFCESGAKATGLAAMPYDIPRGRLVGHAWQCGRRKRSL